jgi:hypothetical protein
LVIKDDLENQFFPFIEIIPRQILLSIRGISEPFFVIINLIVIQNGRFREAILSFGISSVFNA